MRSGANIIVLVVAIAFGIVAVFLARDWVASHGAPTAEAVPQNTIVVANASIPFGAQITADNSIEVSWPDKSRPDGAFKSIAELNKDGKRVALSPFVRNEPILSTKVTAPNQSASLSTVISPGMRAVTVPVDDVRGVAGFISPGDFVDVVLTRSNGGADAQQNFAEVILQHVKVLAIDQLTGDRQEKAVVAKAVTVELSPEQSLKILLATNSGKLSLILRQSAEAALGPQQRVTDGDLFTTDVVQQVAPTAPPTPAAVEGAAPAVIDSNNRKVTIVRGLLGEDYDVPKGENSAKDAIVN